MTDCKVYSLFNIISGQLCFFLVLSGLEQFTDPGVNYNNKVLGLDLRPVNSSLLTQLQLSLNYWNKQVTELTVEELCVKIRSSFFTPWKVIIAASVRHAVVSCPDDLLLFVNNTSTDLRARIFAAFCCQESHGHEVLGPVQEVFSFLIYISVKVRFYVYTFIL